MEYGKFNSAEELLKGYRELESRFTQKCQQLSLAEKQLQQERVSETPQKNATTSSENNCCANNTETATDGTSTEVSPSQEATQSTTVDNADTVPQAETAQYSASDGAASVSIPTEQQLQQYLKDHPEKVLQLLQRDSENVVGVMSGGGNVSLALPSRPRSIKEASLMAKDLFKN